MSLVVEVTNGSRLPICRRTRRNEIDATSCAITICWLSPGYAPGACDRANHLFWTADGRRGVASVSVLALSTNRADEPWAQRSQGTGGGGMVAAPRPAGIPRRCRDIEPGCSCRRGGKFRRTGARRQEAEKPTWDQRVGTERRTSQLAVPRQRGGAGG